LAIYRLLQNSPLGPEEIKRITDAHEEALRVLRLVDRLDPITELIATKIIEITETGERDLSEIRARTLEELGIEPPP